MTALAIGFVVLVASCSSTDSESALEARVSELEEELAGVTTITFETTTTTTAPVAPTTTTSTMAPTTTTTVPARIDLQEITADNLASWRVQEFYPSDLVQPIRNECSFASLVFPYAVSIVINDGIEVFEMMEAREGTPEHNTEIVSRIERLSDAALASVQIGNSVASHGDPLGMYTERYREDIITPWLPDLIFLKLFIFDTESGDIDESGYSIWSADTVETLLSGTSLVAEMAADRLCPSG